MDTTRLSGGRDELLRHMERVGDSAKHIKAPRRLSARQDRLKDEMEEAGDDSERVIASLSDYCAYGMSVFDGLFGEGATDGIFGVGISETAQPNRGRRNLLGPLMDHILPCGP